MPPPGDIPPARLVGLLLRDLADEGLGGEQQRGDRGRVLQRGADDLGRVDDAGLDQVLVLVGLGVEALVAPSSRGPWPRPRRPRGRRCPRSGAAAPRARAGRCATPTASSPAAFTAVDRLRRAQQRDAAAGDDALLDRRLGRVHRVLDAGLLLLHLGLGRRADLDHRHAADQLGQPLLQLLAVVVGGRLLDLGADLLDPALDVLGLAGALDDRGVVLVDRDLLGLAEVVELDVLELDARGPR